MGRKKQKKLSEELEELYYDPQKPTGFAGAHKLLAATKNRHDPQLVRD